MSLVGPRPEVPHYVACYPESVRNLVLSVRPGITDNASIEFKDENKILGKSINPNEAYIKEILPIKIQYYLDYVNSRTFFGDFLIIMRTINALVR
jgi:lipopolysaccharide/colanic/teichoic acid biosynthesis glycosyltransferase